MGNQGQLYFGLFLTSDTLLMAIILLSGFLALAIVVSMMRIYKKCGKAAISVIIPIWGQIVLFQITGIAWWYVFIPIVNLIMMIKAYIVLAKKFGKKTGFAVGMIFLPMIFIPLLSFYDYEGDSQTEEALEPIYNPFNETNPEPVKVEEPISSVIPVAPILEDNKEDNGSNSVVELEEPVVNIPEEVEVPTVPTEDVSTETFISDVQEPAINENVLAEVPVGATDTNNEEIVNGEVLESVVNNNLNPSVQDIEEALNINKEVVDVAFNSTPIEEVKQDEVVEPVQIIDENSDVEEVIEMPEIAAKVCPACGVSLAENINFCTSCGTKL